MCLRPCVSAFVCECGFSLFLESCVFALKSDRPHFAARIISVGLELLKSIHHAKVWRKYPGEQLRRCEFERALLDEQVFAEGQVDAHHDTTTCG